MSSERIRIIGYSTELIQRSKDIILKNHLASNDALILATAVLLKDHIDHFVSSDIAQLRAADLHKLRVLDPLTT
jgi:predicted nucleic acid-binding protein